METKYAGITAVDGKLFNVDDKPNPERRPFRAILDVGLIRTTTGNKIFGVLKGAVMVALAFHIMKKDSQVTHMILKQKKLITNQKFTEIESLANTLILT